MNRSRRRAKSAHGAGSATHGTAALSLGALGVVFGDIGTSPLYALRESFTGEGHELAVTEANVLGVLSLIFWSLVVVVAVKYLAVVMRADNGGEGGILALTALVLGDDDRTATRRRRLLIMLGLFGTALLYGDGMITPAISVLSAVEGTEVVTSRLDAYVLPIAVVILVGLFSVQRRGTDTIGRFFGPVMVLWFGVLGALGAAQIAQHGDVLRAVSPTYALTFFGDNTMTGFFALGSIFLVVTGGEALYADMGHFGRRPITVAWYALVLPGLLLNYFGQGALLLDDPTAIDQPFYRLAPDWGLVPLVVLATLATVIASQALISGAFSLTAQATQLGYAPRLHIDHTSAAERGQVYVPVVNWVLMVACVGLVVGFRSSANLAAAYGIAVTMTMVITTVIFFAVARERFGWRRGPALAVCGAFLIVDLAFFGANIPKIPTGGWFPLLIGGTVYVLLTTWRWGRRLVFERLAASDLALTDFATGLNGTAARVPGTAVYLSSRPDTAPAALQTNARLAGAIHERVLVVSISTARIPKVQPVYRLSSAAVSDGIEAVYLKFGFLDDPAVPAALAFGDIDVRDATYYVGSEAIEVDPDGRGGWRRRLYATLHRLAVPASNSFSLPTDRTISIGSHVQL